MDFAGKWKFGSSISVAIIIIGLGFLLIQGFNLSIDFTGGNLLEVQFSESVDSGQVRNVLAKYNLEKSPIQSAGINNYIIRTGVLTEEANKELITALGKELGEMEVYRNEKVDAVIGKELTRNGILALVLASVGILLYITWRFEFNFAVGGIVALLHDILIMVAFMAIFRLEVDSTFVAAILTTLGYSINDTIVIFDRIRENMKSGKYKDIKELVNTSIMQNMRRTLFTGGTTMVTLIALIVLGGETTKVFCIALLVGCVFGMYSSIFIASPVWMVMKERRSSGGKPLRMQKA